jgi:alkylation response protein AidB-like acyl-CoA dehydrogenase
MDFTFSETQILIRDTARKFAEEALAPSADERDEKEIFPYDAVKAMGELGFMGMMVSEKWGGAGLDTISYVIAMEEISKVDASAGVIMSVNNSLVCWGIEEFGTDDQKERYLRDLATGKKLGAFCLSEPEAGSDATNQRTTATKDGDAYLLNGTKNWITNGANADVYLVVATTDRSKGTKGVSAFIVEKGMPGLSIGKKERKLGIRSSDTVSLGFQDVRVPKENRIGEEGAGIKFALKTLDGGRIAVSLLPRALAARYARLEPYGFMVVILLLATGVLNSLMAPLVSLGYAALGAIVGL